MKTKAEINQLANSLKPIVEAAISQQSDEVLCVRDVALMLGISDSGVKKRCSRKQIPYTKKHGRLYFSKNAINKYYLTD